MVKYKIKNSFITKKLILIINLFFFNLFNNVYPLENIDNNSNMDGNVILNNEFLYIDSTFNVPTDFNGKMRKKIEEIYDCRNFMEKNKSKRINIDCFTEGCDIVQNEKMMLKNHNISVEDLTFLKNHSKKAISLIDSTLNNNELCIENYCNLLKEKKLILKKFCNLFSRKKQKKHRQCNMNLIQKPQEKICMTMNYIKKQQKKIQININMRKKQIDFFIKQQKILIIHKKNFNEYIKIAESLFEYHKKYNETNKEKI